MPQLSEMKPLRTDLCPADFTHTSFPGNAVGDLGGSAFAPLVLGFNKLSELVQQGTNRKVGTLPGNLQAKYNRFQFLGLVTRDKT